ncbi:hypothetical protein SZ64_11060 [Erythrobacter sp. SG61-1L]|uniref:transferrin-binding protein-like solute binding protein n=1 Tax=Erythrobacter sp. SG61-1L TaxID=1603897 RepID=UPI0006C92E8B|nr:transferrin-binding protein-like solute binding protein [Erythrobacter sp. SG61-1L]KPL68596.1 hypothetical protein SZ64_11060 [Erythrobacter sp. SG61-1L]
MGRRGAIAIFGSALLVSACGGGGGTNSTPNPPGGGGSSGGGGGSSFPSSANADLVTLSKNESFTNDSVQAKGRFTLDGLTSSSTSRSGLTIDYDASAKSYRLSGGGKTTTFLQSDIDQANSGGGVVLMVKENGDTIQTLSRVDNSAPVASTRYVTSALWQYVVENSSSVDYSVSVATYGVETPNASLPRTGAADYAILVNGVLLYGQPWAYGGSGNLTVDFATGKLAGDGKMYEFDPVGGTKSGDYDFFLTATLSGSGNSFSGEFGYNYFEAMRGTIAGRFYGPNADEVGATWEVRPQSNSTAVGVGAITGVKSGNSSAAFAKLADLTGRFDLPSTFANSGYYGPKGMRFDLDAKTYGIIGPAGNVVQTFRAADRFSDPDFAAFDSFSSSNDDVLRMFKWGDANPEVKLTYSSFAIYEHDTPDVPSTRQSDYIVYGLFTQPNLLPHTGSATYRGSIYGNASDTNGKDANLYALSGQGTFTVDFSSGSISGGLSSVVGRDADTNATKNFGNFTGYGSLDSANRSIFTLSMDYNHDIVRPLAGSMRGGLFGPGATEMVGAFGITWQAPDATNTWDFPYYSVNGVFVGK